MTAHDTYQKTPSLKSKPKVQRAIIADILLQAEGPLTFAQIVVEAKKRDYEDTFRRAKQVVTIEESVSYHLDAMLILGTVKKQFHS